MNCECGGKMRVIDTAVCGKGVYRQRRCKKCRDVIYTEELQVDRMNGRYMLHKGREMQRRN